MNRDLLINILLILAGIVLAVGLFAAGVLWKRKVSVEHAVTSRAMVVETVTAIHVSWCLNFRPRGRLATQLQLMKNRHYAQNPR